MPPPPSSTLSFDTPLSDRRPRLARALLGSAGVLLRRPAGHRRPGGVEPVCRLQVSDGGPGGLDVEPCVVLVLAEWARVPTFMVILTASIPPLQCACSLQSHRPLRPLFVLCVCDGASRCKIFKYCIHSENLRWPAGEACVSPLISQRVRVDECQVALCQATRPSCLWPARCLLV